MTERNVSNSRDLIKIDVKVASTAQMSDSISIKIVEFSAFALVNVFNNPHGERVSDIILKIDHFGELLGDHLKILLFDPIIQI
jgi:hypothetical protein